MGHPHQLAPPIAFFHLAIDQARRHLPPEDFPPSTSHISPLPKMSREGIKVEIQAITREERETERRPRCVAGSGRRYAQRFACGDLDGARAESSYRGR